MATKRLNANAAKTPLVDTDEFVITDTAGDDYNVVPPTIEAYTRNKAYEWTTQTLTDQATLDWDRELGHIAYLECTQAAVLNGIDNPVKGNYDLIVKKAGASADITFDAAFLFVAGTKPDLAGSTLNSYTKYSIFYDGTSKFICTGAADIR